MKSGKIGLLLSILLSIIGTKVWAYDIAVENADGVTIYYNYINDGKELEVTNKSAYNSYSYRDAVVIPEEVTYMNRNRKVTRIGVGAFYNCSPLTSVTIPNGVTSIETNAFNGCWQLTSITIPQSVTSIGENAFSNRDEKSVYITDLHAWCNINFFNYNSNPLYHAKLFLNGEEVKELVIPNSVTSIGSYAFFGYSGMTSVIISNGVTSIGNCAFADCSGLTSVTIPTSVTSIGNSAFYKCDRLTSVTIPNSVMSIGESAFFECSSMTSVSIGNGVTSIGSFAFKGWDLQKVISKIDNPFNIEADVFSLNTFLNATLYVPAGTINQYKATEGWNKFSFIEEGNGGGDNPSEIPKCEKPTISYQKGKLTFYSSTEGAICHSTITNTDISSYSSNEIQLGVTYNISVYATKVGYDNSETATATLCWIDTEPQTEGIVNGVAEVRANPILIQTGDGWLTVNGANDGTKVCAYDTNGVLSGAAISKNGSVTLNTNLQVGSVVIVKVENKSIKAIIK